jgi:hypothetical protein
LAPNNPVFFFGTHYLTLQMLEGFVPRDQIRLGRVPNGSRHRFDLLKAARSRRRRSPSRGPH